MLVTTNRKVLSPLQERYAKLVREECKTMEEYQGCVDEIATMNAIELRQAIAAWEGANV